MRVTVRYMAQARQAAGVASELVEVPAACAVETLLQDLAEKRGVALRRILLTNAGGVQPALLLFLGNDQVIEHAAPLHDGSTLTVLAPMAGG